MKPKDLHLFPFLNQELVRDIIGLAERVPAAVAKFSAKNLGYVGEIAERWQENKVIESAEEAASLIVGLNCCYRAENFYYNQREMFFDSMSKFLLEREWSLMAAFALLEAASSHFESWETQTWTLQLRERIEKESFSGMLFPESVFSVSAMIRVFRRTKNAEAAEQWKKIAIRLLDGLEASISDPFSEYPLIAMLGDAQYDLGKPKASEFKKKGVTALLATISSLRDRELDEDQTAKAAGLLGVSVKIACTLNYLLLTTETSSHRKITQPGLLRAAERFVRAHMLDSEPLAAEFKKLSQSRSLDFSILLAQWDKMSLPEAFAFLQEKVAEKEISRLANLSYIPILQDERAESLSESLRQSIVEKLLCNRTVQMSRERFLYLEQERVRFGVSFTPGYDYSRASFVFEVVALDNPGLLEDRGMVEHAIQYMGDNRPFDVFLDFMESLNEKHYASIVKNLDRHAEKTRESDALAQRLYVLFLKGLFHFNPSGYGDQLAGLLEKPAFVRAMALSEEDVAEMELELLKNDLLPSSTKERVRKKHMTEEEKENEFLKKFEKDLESQNAWGMKSRFSNHLEKLKANEKARDIFANAFAETQVKDSHDFSSFLGLFYQLKSKCLITAEQTEKIEARALALAANY